MAIYDVLSKLDADGVHIVVECQFNPLTLRKVSTAALKELKLKIE